jgi:hypothetical protein
MIVPPDKASRWLGCGEYRGERIVYEREGRCAMSRDKIQAQKHITLHWRNFIIVILVILLVGIIIGLIITPHPDYEKKPGPEEVIKQASYSGSSFFP